MQQPHHLLSLPWDGKPVGINRSRCEAVMAVNKVDAILARFPGPVTQRVNRLKMLALLAGSLAFVVGGVFQHPMLQ